MSNVETIIATLSRLGARLILADDGSGLRLEIGEGSPDLPEALIKRIRDRKAEIVAHLRGAAPADPIADPPAPAAAPIAEPELEPAIYLMIDGKRQRLSLATIIAPGPSGPEPPRAVNPAEVLPYELGDPDEEETARFERARSRRRAMSVREATLLEARLTFGDVDAWRAWRRGL